MIITTQKLHKLIQNGIGVLSSKYSISQRIDRATYDVRKYNGFIGIMSAKHINEIVEILKNDGLNIDATNVDRGFIKIYA